MADMKMSQSELNNYESIEVESPEYPYGLSIYLDNDSLKKLGKTAADFSVGEDLSIVATVKVKSISSNQGHSGNKDSVDLQITDLEFTDSSGGADDDRRAESLYGG